MKNFHTSIFANERSFKEIYSILLLGLIYLIVLLPGLAIAQVVPGKEFKPRTSQLTTPPGQSVYNVKGDFTMIGNTNLTLQNYTNSRANGDNTSIYVDVDGDPNTINSSSATLSFSSENGADPACSNIIYAGLYWTGRAHNSSSPMTFSTPTSTTDRYDDDSFNGYTLTIAAGNASNDPGTTNSRIATYTFTPLNGGQVVVFRFRSWRIGSSGSNYTGSVTVQLGTGTEIPVAGSISSNSDNNFAFTFSSSYPINSGSPIQINSLRKRRIDNGINSNYRTSVTTPGKSFNKRQVKLKKAGGSYQTITANENDIYYPDNTRGNMYSAYADVTDIIQAGKQGEYFVADMALNVGTGDGTGYYGGWGLVVVYENSKMKWRDITVFDGHAYMPSNGSDQTLDVSGFQAVQTGDVGVKIAMMAGEGDQEYTGDAFDIRSSGSTNASPTWLVLANQDGATNNFFNSRIVGVPSRNPNLVNNSGLDIKVMELDNSAKNYITNNQTSTRFRYRTGTDTYIIFSIVFAVDAYVPEVEPVNTVITVNGNPYISGNPVSPGDEVGYTLQVKNLGTEAINNSFIRIPVPYMASFVSGSLSHTTHASVSPNAPPTFNATDGALGAVNWNIGTLPLPADPNNILATLSYKFKVTSDCFLLSNPICIPSLAVTGNITGIGANTGASVGNSGAFISGFQNVGSCTGEPIREPVKITVNPGQTCQDYEYQPKEFNICDGATSLDILAAVRAGFPPGTRFYSAVDAGGEGSGTEYNESTPFPTNTPNATYYAIPPGSVGCYFEFKLKIIILNTPPTVEAQPVNYCVGATAVPLTATASNPSYILYYYTGVDGNGNPTGAAQTSITPSTTVAGTFEYYVTQGTANCQSAPAKITVIVSAPPVITVPLENLILCEGSTGSISVTATGSNLTYAWEYNSGSGWVTLPNATQDKINVNGNTLTLSGASSIYNGGKVRVIVSNGNCSVISGEATITVTSVAAPTTTQSTQTFCEIEPHTVAQLSATALTGGTIQWYDAATGGNLLSPTTILVDGQKYYASQTVGGCESVQRLEVTVAITVIAAPTTTQSTQTFCEIAPHTVANLQAVGTGIQWYDAATGGNLLSPTTTLVDGQKYYASQTVGGCESVQRLEVTVAINIVQAGTIAGSQTVCNGTAPATITSVTAGSATGILAYQWEFSVDNGASWVPINGATAATYTPGAMTVTTSYRRVSTSTLNSSVCTVYSNEVVITVTNNCNVITEKSVSDNSNNGKAESNEELTYSIKVTNNYDRDITVNISDIIPANTAYLNNTSAGVYTSGNNTITWNNLTIPANSNATVTFVVKVVANLTGITNIYNVATVSGNELPEPQRPEVEIPTENSPSHSSVKTVVDASGDNKAQSGEELTYTITVKNTGDVALTGIAISDMIPANTAYVAGSATGNATLTGSTLNWSVNVPFGGEVSVSFKVTVNADLTGVTSIKNIATVDGDTPEVEIPTENSPSHSSVKTVVDASGDNKAQSGEELTYTITVKNTGDVALTGIAISDMIPANTAYVANSATGGGSLTGSTLNWSVNVPFGGEVSVSFKVKVNSDLTEAAVIRNIATVGGENPEVEIPTDRLAGITIEKRHNLPASNDCYGLKTGDKITYTFVVKNTGNVGLSNVTVTDVLPRIGAVMSTESGSLAPGATRVFTAEYVVDQNDINVGSIRNTASVKGTAPSGTVTGTTEGVVGISSNEVVINICQLGKVAIDKTVNKETVSKVGEELIYTIKVTNTGNTDLEEVTVEDVMLGFKEVINLKVGEVKTYSLTYVVKYADLLKASSDNTASLDNIASATLKTREKVTDNASTKITFIPDIDIVKSADKSVVTFLGEEVEYTIEVKNSGSVDLVNVLVTDPMFPNFTGNAGNLAVGETKKFELTYVSVLADIIRGEIKNTAQVKGTVAGAVAFRSFNPTTGVIEKLSNEVVIPVLFNSVLEVTKIADKTEVQKVGEVINYTITVANKGQYDLKNVQVRDPLTGLNETIATLVVGETVSFNKEKNSKISYAVVRSDFDNGKIVNVVTATATDLKGGAVSGNAERIVTVLPMPLFIPNVYTPNGDNVNDTFEIVGIEAFDRTEVTILNRWGNEVYRNDNYRNEWSGQGLNEGTYFYIIKTIKGTKEDVYKGHVLIKTR